MLAITGPFGSSAAVPSASLTPGATGTPNSMTERRPLRTSVSTKGTSVVNTAAVLVWEGWDESLFIF